MDDRAVVEVLREGLRGIENQFVDFREEMRGQMRELNAAVTKRLDDHSNRLRSLEAWRAWLIGGIGAMGIAIVAMWTAFLSLVRGSK